MNNHYEITFLLHTLSISSSLWNYILINIFLFLKGLKPHHYCFILFLFCLFMYQNQSSYFYVINPFFQAKLYYNHYYLAMLERFKQCFGCTRKGQEYEVKQPHPLKPIQTTNNGINISLKLIDGSNVKFQTESSLNGRQLKIYIYCNISKELSAQRMCLYHNNKKLENQTIISQLEKQNEAVNLIQKKIEIANQDNLPYRTNKIGQCPFSLNIGTAIMSCKHQIGQDALRQLIQSIIKMLKYQIRCPVTLDNGTTCNQIWQIKHCKQICAYTTKQFSQIQAKLSENSLKNLIRQCPKCKNSVAKIGLSSNRVVCSVCKYGDFCFDCLKPWSNKGNFFCGNKDCEEAHKILANCEQKNFSLKIGEQYSNYKVPIYRSCINCKSIIEHADKCKHMKCKYCNNDFCFVCLSVPKNGVWACGKAYDYCGKVGERQKLS